MTARPVIDSHVHVWSQDVVRYPFGPHDDLEPPTEARTGSEYLADGDGERSAGVLLIQPRIYGYDHAFLFDAAERLPVPTRVMPLVNVARRHSVDTVRRLAADERTAAFRVVALGRRPAEWLCSREADRVWAAAAQLDLPVGLLIDAWQLTLVDRLAAAHPELAIVVDHMARCGPALRAERGPELCALAERSNVLVKLSAIPALSEAPYPHADLWPLIGSLHEAFGASRLLWGSDWPHDRRYGRSRAAIAQALPAAPGGDLEEIFCATAARIFRFGSVDVAGGTDDGD